MANKLKNYKTNKPCLACFINYSEENCLHHVKTRGAGGCDSEFNLMPLCQTHHNEVHYIGLNKFADYYEDVKAFLINHGYEKDKLTNKWVRYEK